MLHARARSGSRFGLFASLVVSLASALAFSLLGAAPAHAVINLVANPNFEASTWGWKTNADARIARARPARTGTYSARVTNTAATARTTVLNDAANTVSATIAGATYDVSAWVRTSTPGIRVNLRVMEFAGTRTLRGQANRNIVLSGTGWHQLRLAYVATGGGNNIDLNVLSWSLAPGAAFSVDAVSLSRRTSAPATTQPSLTGWRLVWSDEFSGTALNRAKWNVENYSTYGDGNGELACLMDRPENVRVAGGTLTIRARKEATPYVCKATDSRFPNGRSYTSAMLHTRGKASWKYGRFEVRAKLPTQQGSSKGLWPAFWMRPDAGGTGELDILEAIGSSGTSSEYTKVHQTIHYDYLKTHPLQPHTHTFPAGTTPSDGFHTYAAEWEPGEIRWYIDGKLTYTRNRSTTSWLDEAFSKPFFLRLNLAVGGSWPGSPDSATAWPADFVVDSVRVYQR